MRRGPGGVGSLDRTAAAALRRVQLGRLRCETVGATIEDWAKVRGDASTASKWAKGALVQIDRFLEAWTAAHSRAAEKPPVIDYDARSQAFVDGYFMVLAADRVRKTLTNGAHEDLVELLPAPAEWELLNAETGIVAGAEYLRHVRNAHEHDDEDGRFEKGYGYSHRWTVGSAADPYNLNFGGVTIGPLFDAMKSIMETLDARGAEASTAIERLTKERS